jgi:hypothetical protein
MLIPLLDRSPFCQYLLSIDSESNMIRASRGYVSRHGARKDTLEGSESNHTAAPKQHQQLESANFILTQIEKGISVTNF